MAGYLDTADVWTVLDLIVAEFTSDPTSVQCFDLRLVKRAVDLNREHREGQPPAADALTDDDKQKLVAIQSSEDPHQIASALHEYYGDLDRAGRTSRSQMYFHMGMLAGAVLKLSAPPRLATREKSE